MDPKSLIAKLDELGEIMLELSHEYDRQLAAGDKENADATLSVCQKIIAHAELNGFKYKGNLQWSYDDSSGDSLELLDSVAKSFYADYQRQTDANDFEAARDTQRAWHKMLFKTRAKGFNYQNGRWFRSADARSDRSTKPLSSQPSKRGN